MRRARRSGRADGARAAPRVVAPAAVTGLGRRPRVDAIQGRRAGRAVGRRGGRRVRARALRATAGRRSAR